MGREEEWGGKQSAKLELRPKLRNYREDLREIEEKQAADERGRAAEARHERELEAQRERAEAIAKQAAIIQEFVSAPACGELCAW